jgi:hypothetical protein
MRSLYNYMKPSLNPEPKKRVEKKDNLKVKANEIQSKDIMESLFNDYFEANCDDKMEIINENNIVPQQSFQPRIEHYNTDVANGKNLTEKSLNKLEISKMKYDVMIQPTQPKYMYYLYS